MDWSWAIFGWADRGPSLRLPRLGKGRVHAGPPRRVRPGAGYLVHDWNCHEPFGFPLVEAVLRRDLPAAILPCALSAVEEAECRGV